VTDPIMMPEFRRSDVMRIHHDNKIQSGLPNKYEYLGHIDNDMAIEYYSIKCPKNHITTISKSNLSIRKSKNQEICNLCNEYIGSMAEQEVFDYIKTIYFGNITRSDRKLIKPLEIDMVLEDIKICIEFNGDYWHSTKIIDDQYYHMDKSKSCISKGFRLLQIKERDWYEKKDEVKNKMSQFIENHPIKIDKNIYTLDLSWYDDRFLKIGNWKLIAQNKPILINVGQYLQWSGGEEIYKLL
jgi:very-short-patch-repair endonuclease